MIWGGVGLLLKLCSLLSCSDTCQIWIDFDIPKETMVPASVISGPFHTSSVDSHHKGPVLQSFDVLMFCFFSSLNKVLNKQSSNLRCLNTQVTTLLWFQALCILANVADGETAKSFIMTNEDVLKKLMN